MLESEFWAEMREALPEPHWQRIESGSTALGIPDLNGCLEGVEVWVENKVLNNGIKIQTLTPFQVSWLVKRSRAGGRCFLACRVQKNDWRGLIVWEGGATREVKRRGLGAEPLAVSILPEPVDYNVVREVFFGHHQSFHKRAW